MGKKQEMESEEKQKIHNPTKSRSCTDVLCLLLFLAFLGGWGAISYLAFSQGNPLQIVYPSNSSGHICGRDENEEKSNLFFHDLTKCISVTAALGCPTPQVCVKKCPKKTTSLYACLKASEIAGLPPSICSDLLEEYREYCTPMSDEDWELGKEDPLQLIQDRKCPAYTLQSIPVIGRCIPDFGIIEDSTSNDTIISDGIDDILDANGDTLNSQTVYEILEYMTKLLNAREISEKVWADLVSSWYWILAGQGLALVVSFLWILLMRFLPGPMIYISMILAIGLLGLSSAYSWVKYSSLAEQPGDIGIFDVNPLTDDLSTYLAIRDTWLVFFVISIVIFIIVALILIFLRTRINIAIELIKESSKAISGIISSLFFPVIPFLLQLIVVAYFCTIAAFLASTGEQQFVVAQECPDGPKNGEPCSPADFTPDPSCLGINSTCIFNKFAPSETNQYLQLYNLFGLFWGLFFVSALGEMVLAGCFSSWYWAFNKSKDVPSFPILSSFYRTFRYHLGSLAFGSLIIAILRMIRLAIQYVEEKIKEKGMDNPVTKVVLCLCKCCFWCLEKFMKFLNRNAFIITASYGYNFCRSAKEAFSLILRNVARVVVLDKVTDFLLLLGKLVVTGSLAVLSFYVFSGGLNGIVPLELESPKLNYYFVPIIIITISGYMIADCFFSVFSMAVDTIFLSFLLDLERNENAENPQYCMSKNLMKILNLRGNKKSKSKKSD